MCLQEVEEANYHDSLKPWLDANGYTYAYKRRTGDDENKPDGVLTACLVGKYEIVDTVQVEYFRCTFLMKGQIEKCCVECLNVNL